MPNEAEIPSGKTFFPNAFERFAKGLTGDRGKDATALAESVLGILDDYAPVRAPEWPALMDYGPEQVARLMSGGADPDNRNLKEQLSQFGAWRDQVMAVESRNGGTIMLLLETAATIARLELNGAVHLSTFITHHYAPPKHRRRWEKHAVLAPYVWQERADREAKTRVMRAEFELLPGWLRGGSPRMETAPERPKRETRTPQRMGGGFRSPDDEDVL